MASSEEASSAHRLFSGALNSIKPSPDQSLAQRSLLQSYLPESLPGRTEDTVINRTRFDLEQRESPGLPNNPAQLPRDPSSLCDSASPNGTCERLRTRWQMWNSIKAQKPAAKMRFAHILTTSLPKLLQRADLCKLTFPLVPHTMPLLPATSLTAPTWEACPIEKVNLEEGIFF